MSGHEPPADAIAITGFMGTGKTTVGRIVAQRLGLQFTDTDQLIEERAGQPIPAIFASHGEAHFRDLESQALREALSEPGAVLSTGGGMLLREANLITLRRAGPIICLTAVPETILERTSPDATRPLLQVDDRLARIEELLAARAECYAQADIHISTDGRTPDEVADAIIAAMAADPRGRWLVGAQTTLPVDVPGHRYEITVGRGLLARIGAVVPPREPGMHAALITTDRIAALYADRVQLSLSSAGWRVTLLTVPDGEQSKRLEVAGTLLGGLAQAGLDRASTVFALGGGVVGDLAGFVAAVYMRGIGLIHLPTSLLAQVDSSIGGKNAVDLDAGKNLAGAFHQPVAVVADVETLETLPVEELRSGLGEIIKHACCFDAGMFSLLEARRNDVLGGNPAILEYLVARNCQIKADVVRQDPHEKGLRAVLNYGHTVGHALERAAPDWALRHGEVVGVGIVAEARLAEWLGLADHDTTLRQEALVEAYGLPTEVGVSEPLALQALERDKKIEAGRLRMPLVPEIGSFEIVDDVELELVRRALRSVLAEQAM